MLKSLSIKTKIQLIAVALLLGLSLSLVLSQTADPSLPMFFGLKRVQEKVFMKLKSNPGERLDFMSGMLNSRLVELNSVVRGEKYDHVLYSSLRYSTLAGEMTDEVLANNLKSYVDPVKNQFSNHLIKLKEIYDYYPKNTSNLEYKYIEDDINYLKIYLDKLPKI